jgi:hypothetical protein
MVNHEKKYNIDPFEITVFPIISENLEVVFVFKIFYTAVEFVNQQKTSTCIYISRSEYLTHNSAIEAAIKYIDVMLIHQTNMIDKLYDELFPNKI